MTKIVKATTKGQITLPASWRKQFNTDQFLLNLKGNKVTIEPVEIVKKPAPTLSLKEVLDRENKKPGFVVFDAIRDNKGKGIEVGKVLKILKEIDG